ncbi:MAG: protein kinase, partial [Chloroflexi bacterium]|nr:protein kinase [Chloroflexota bacterium]
MIANESATGNAVRGYNPNVDGFLTIYSQSERSTGGTRGYDPETYVETKLDRNLIPRITSPKTKLVILTGNAGDGKTAFIQHVEALLEEEGADIKKRTDNGCIFISDGLTYQTLYDGSQDFEGTANDAVLAAFFNELEGDKPPEGDFTKVIAINEGKLRDFILNKPHYRWIGKQIHHYFNYGSFKPHDSLVFVNLNLRSVVDINEEDNSIFDLLLNKFLQDSFWEPCASEKCDDSEFCPIRHNVSNFNDSQRGVEIRRRLEHLLLAVHLRKIRHITMRDLRSILSLILFGKLPCSKIHARLAEKANLIGSFYYNAVFSGG